MSSDKKEIERLKRRIAGLEKTLKIVAGHSDREEKSLKHLFDDVSNTIPVPILISSNCGEIIFFNKNAQTIFAYSDYDFKNLNALKLYENPEDRQVLIQKLKENNGKTTSFSVSMKKSDGTIFPATLFSRYIKYENRKCLLTVTYDLSDVCREEQKRIKLEKQLRHTQKMEAVGNLAGGIAHDFNNLLHAINGYTQLLLLKRTGKSEGYKELKQIEKTAARAAKLVQQLLTFSRKADTKRKTINLNKELEQGKKILERTIPKMISITLEPAPDLKKIHADPTQLEQVFLNTGSNAADAMPDGGEFKIKTENIYLDENFCNVNTSVKPGEYVLLTISDTGHGMNKEVLSHIFEPFYTTKELGKGTGLGLASVYGIVQNHGAYITCKSETGKGTVFQIYFPAVSHNKDVQNKHIKEKQLKGGPETILIVDDEKPVRDLAKEILQDFGYNVLTADSGEKALEIYKNKINRIDLVILDIGMPGMGGHKCLSKLIEFDINVRIMIASGYSVDSQLKKNMESGAAGFIGKPYQLNEFLFRVRDILDKD